MILHAVFCGINGPAFLVADPADEFVCMLSLHVFGLFDNFREYFFAEQTLEVLDSGFRLGLLWLCAFHGDPRCSLNFWLHAFSWLSYCVNMIVSPCIMVVFNVSCQKLLCFCRALILNVRVEGDEPVWSWLNFYVNSAVEEFRI